MTYQINIGADAGPVYIPARYLNRHGLIAGATGTGKSVSVMTLAEGFSRLGVPVFVTDIKGDLSGMGAPSTGNAAADFPGWRAEAAPLRLLDVFGERGQPFTASIRSMGAPLVARALGLTDIQTGVLEIAFAVAEDEGQPLDTLADLRAVVAYCTEHRQKVAAVYGLVTPSSVAAIGRAVLRLERAGGASFFRPGKLNLSDLMTADPLGRGVVSMLDCVRLIREPRLYGAVLLALLDRMADELPEIGDTEKPRIALIFDEAHLIFDDCPPELLRLIDQTVRLIRSKGVGIFFASQAPQDVPDAISRQLHLRIQHALRSVTPSDAAAVRAAAQSMPEPEGFKAADVIGKLGKGEALISFMGEDGALTAARRVKVALPRCRLSPLNDAERAALMGEQEEQRQEERDEREAARIVREAEQARDQRQRNERHERHEREELTAQQQSDRRHGWLYIGTAAAGAFACIPWAGMVAPLADMLPPFFGFVLNAAPVGASLAMVAGFAKGRALKERPRRRARYH